MQSNDKERESLSFSGDRVGDCRGFGLFGSRRNAMPSIFGGRDPFDDPFFNRPFNDMFESSIHGPRVSSNDKMSNDGAAAIVIEELDSDVDDDESTKSTEGTENQKHYGSKKEPFVLHPDDGDDEMKNDNKFERVQPEARRHSIQTCKVTYGGVNGAYFTSTRTRKADSDGVVIEERKDANRTTGQATHRISRGIHNKGHSVTRMLNSDGKVETVQTFHNLSSDDLSGFEEAWKANSKEEFSVSKDGHEFSGRSGSSTTQRNQKANWGGFLPQSSEQRIRSMGEEVQTRSNSSAGKKKVIRINIE